MDDSQSSTSLRTTANDKTPIISALHEETKVNTTSKNKVNSIEKNETSLNILIQWINNSYNTISLKS